MVLCGFSTDAFIIAFLKCLKLAPLILVHGMLLLGRSDAWLLAPKLTKHFQFYASLCEYVDQSQKASIFAGSRHLICRLLSTNRMTRHVQQLPQRRSIADLISRVFHFQQSQRPGFNRESRQIGTKIVDDDIFHAFLEFSGLTEQE